METIKCSKCGCEMSVMSEACPMCETPTHVPNKEVANELQQTDYVRRSDVKMLEGLKEVMDTMIAEKRIAPMSNIVVITEDGGYIDGREYCVDWQIEVPFNYTNNASIYLCFGKTDEDKKRIMQLENASIFNQEFYDCGTDTEKATYLFSEYVRKVYMYDGEVMFDSVEIEKATFDNVELYLSEGTSNQWTKLKTLVDGYNILAQKNGYLMLSIDKNLHLLKGSFPSDKKVGGFLSKNARIHKRMNTDFERILSHCHTFLKDWQTK